MRPRWSTDFPRRHNLTQCGCGDKVLSLMVGADVGGHRARLKTGCVRPQWFSTPAIIVQLRGRCENGVSDMAQPLSFASISLALSGQLANIAPGRENEETLWAVRSQRCIIEGCIRKAGRRSKSAGARVPSCRPENPERRVCVN